MPADAEAKFDVAAETAAAFAPLQVSGVEEGIDVAPAARAFTAVWAFPRAPTVLKRAMLHLILPNCLASRDSGEARGAIVRIFRW